MWWKKLLLGIALGLRIAELKVKDMAGKTRKRHPLPPHKPKWK